MTVRFPHAGRNRRRLSLAAIGILMMLLAGLFALATPAGAQPTQTPPVVIEQAETPPVEPTTVPVELPIQGNDPEPLEPADEPTVGPVEPDIVQPASIAVSLRACPAGTDPATTDPATLAASCTGEQNGVPFDLRPAAGGIFVWNTGDAGPSSVFFAEVPVGQVTLYGQTQGSAIYCEGLTSQGTTRPYARVPSVVQQQFEAITLAIAEGEQNTCQWYVPGTGGTNTVILRKAACPLGYVATDPPDIYDMALNCQEPAGAIEFSVFEAGGGGYDGGMMTSPGGDGVSAFNSVTFQNVPNVPLWIYEEVPEGYGDPIFFCEVEDQLTNTVVATRSYPWGLGYIEMDAPGENNVVSCDIFNMPVTDSSVTVYKWLCQPGTEEGQTMAFYQGENGDPGPCEMEHLNIPITLRDVSGDRPMLTQANGTQWDDVVTDESGQFHLIEDLPTGFGQPMLFCGTLDDVEPIAIMPANGMFSITANPTFGFTYQCWMYNIPAEHSTVTIRKWECPEGMAIDPTYEAHSAACTQPMDGVEFTLTDITGERSQVTAAGQVQWTDVEIGPITIEETVPLGFDPQPFVVCGFTAMFEGAVIDGFPQPVDAPNGVYNTSIEFPATTFFCDWYNQYLGEGEITVNKWLCPPGYDVHAWNADPKNDCTPTINGVTFVLELPSGQNLQTDTGDSIPGAVYFGGLEPGDYTLNEIVPVGIASVFYLDCLGLNTGAVHPVPLQTGPTLEFTVAGGDEIVCDVFNVEEDDPNEGWVTLHKRICWTHTYVSEVDCETYEDGASFDLLAANGGQEVASGTTDGAGQIAWYGVTPGSYTIREDNGTPCRITATRVDGGGNLEVTAGQETIVTVYNCSASPPTPGGKTPTKYPNTGVEPGASHDGISPFAAIGPIGAAVLSRRRFLRHAVAPAIAVTAGAALFGSGLARQGIELAGTPEGTPGTPAGTPRPDCLFPATPAATPDATPDPGGTPTACARGAVPVRVTIPAIGVDAGIEILETIGGIMQQPTGAEDVAWYRESARLGEIGNLLLAGHLNFWGVPEGVFFRLEALAEGDVVEITGVDAVTHRYVVEWVDDFPSDEEPPADAIGHLDTESVTLITCGGEWNAGRAEYDHRTMVRATREI